MCFYAVVDQAAQTDTSDRRVEQASLFTGAASLADLILNRPGEGWYDAAACQEKAHDRGSIDPDALTRFGLAEERCLYEAMQGAPGAVSYEKIKALNGAGVSAVPDNGLVEYKEAYESLQLHLTGLDFRIEAYPVLRDVEEAFARGYREMFVRPLYIGAYDIKYYNAGSGSGPTENPVCPPLNLDCVDGSDPGREAECTVEELLIGVCTGDWEEEYVEVDIEESALNESAYVAALVANFERAAANAAHDTPQLPYASGGDVAAADAEFLQSFLPAVLTDAAGQPSLEHYNVILIGSDADNDALADATVQGAIRDWVEKGGYLLVFGSESNLQWLNSFAHARLVAESATPAILLPDHPLLGKPNLLDPALFDAGERAWDLDGSWVDRYQVVVGANGKATLAVSTEGAFGKGLVALVAPELHRLTGTDDPDCAPAAIQATCQAALLLHNLFTVLYGPLYVDYGPEVPSGTAVGTYSKLVVAYHPRLGTVVEENVFVKVWSLGPWVYPSGDGPAVLPVTTSTTTSPAGPTPSGGTTCGSGVLRCVK